MFLALLCSSSGGQKCIIQHLVSSHSVGGRPVHRLREGRWPSGAQVERGLQSGAQVERGLQSKHVEEYNTLIIKQEFMR